MKVSNETMTNEEHVGMPVLVLFEGKENPHWENIDAMVVSVVGDKITILSEMAGETRYLVVPRSFVKLKF